MVLRKACEPQTMGDLRYCVQLWGELGETFVVSDETEAICIASYTFQGRWKQFLIMHVSSNIWNSLLWNSSISCDGQSGRCRSCTIYSPAVVLKFDSFLSHFRHHFVHLSFIKLRFYTKDRILNRIPFTACRITSNFSRNGLRMPCRFLCFFLLPTIVPMIQWN